MDRRAAPRRADLKRTIDLELEAGSRAHYDDPAFYTSNYRKRIDDVQFYVACAVASKGPVLEYGVGNGRVALPVARHGVEVWGVDHAAPMLADLRARLADEPREVRRRVRLKRGDMREARIARRFPLVVCPFNAFLHLYTRDDVERFLARVRAHLAPRGQFVFDVSMPMLEDLARRPDRAYRAPRFNYPGEGLVRYEEHFDYDRARQILFVSMRFEPVRDPARAFTVPLAHRQFFPRELEALLHYNGFEIERLLGDFHGGPVERESDVLVHVTRARRGRA